MGLLKNIVAWWEGATWGTAFYTARKGERMGEDAKGNVYYQSRKPENGRHRRWVIYAGQNDSSRIPPDWHSWLHGTIDDVPEKALPPERPWQAEPTPNLTGTAGAYRPTGALERGGHRAPATGDYEAWTPGAS